MGSGASVVTYLEAVPKQAVEDVSEMSGCAPNAPKDFTYFMHYKNGYRVWLSAGIPPGLELPNPVIDVQVICPCS